MIMRYYNSASLMANLILISEITFSVYSNSCTNSIPKSLKLVSRAFEKFQGMNEISFDDLKLELRKVTKMSIFSTN